VINIPTFCFFLCTLFNDAFSVTDYTESNEGVISG
jgi:hypothetical protein